MIFKKNQAAFIRVSSPKNLLPPKIMLNQPSEAQLNQSQTIPNSRFRKPFSPSNSKSLRGTKNDLLYTASNTIKTTLPQSKQFSMVNVDSVS